MGRKNRRKKNQVMPMEAITPKTTGASESNFKEMNKEGSAATWTEMRQMPVGMLEICNDYQRTLNMGHAKHIAANFNPDLVNVIKVSFRNGHYYVFDGQHTTMAIKLKFHDDSYPVMCKIYYGLTVEDESKLFAEQTGFSKALPAAYKMRALSLSGDEDINEFLQITRDSGFMIEPTKSMNKPCAIEAVKMAFNCYHALGAEQYGQMLTLLMLAWHGERWSITQKMLSGMCMFMKIFGDDVDTARFQKKLSVMDEHDVARAAGQFCELSVPYRFAGGIATLYNKGGSKGTLKLRKLTFAMCGED